jgi:hypothetical protein
MSLVPEVPYAPHPFRVPGGIALVIAVLVVLYFRGRQGRAHIALKDAKKDKKKQPKAKKKSGKKDAEAALAAAVAAGRAELGYIGAQNPMYVRWAAFHALPDAVGAIRCTLYLDAHLVAWACPAWLSIPAVLQ